VPGEKGVVAATVERPPTPEQAAAIGAPGLVFVSAGAGTGKTTVLVERFVRAIEAGVDVGSILVITYTDRAAAELRSRIRRRLAELGRPELTRELDGAWISTIHGFCTRLLRQYPFAAGLDPRFRVLDEAQASVLLVEAFDEALTQFCSVRSAPGKARRRATGLVRARVAGAARDLRLAGAAADAHGVHETLRARGERSSSLGDAPGLDLVALRAAASSGRRTRPA
jgi:superfamily I DNA/RNA helicase